MYLALKAEYYHLWKNASNLKDSDKYFKRWQTIERWIERLLDYKPEAV